MRLIDADALLEPDENSDKVLIIGGQNGGGKTLVMAMELLKQKVKNAPTIEAEPVKHGRWIIVNHKECFCRCSECGCMPMYKYNYCPNCGAKMDGGADNG